MTQHRMLGEVGVLRFSHGYGKGYILFGGAYVEWRIYIS